jgi:undecaprenyl-phosphate galactose phosphotransferase
MQELKPTGEPVTLPINSLKPGLHRKVFSSYKPVLLLHDLAILLLSFSLMLFAAGPGLQHQKPGILVLMSMMSLSVFVFLFWAFNLYSYGANFIWNHHFARMKKAFAWVLISFGLFVLLLHWDNLYSDKIVIPLFTAILVFCLLFLKSGVKFLTNLTYALAICLLSIGTIGLVLPDGLSILKTYGYLLPIFYIISVGLLLGGRYLLVHIVFNGWMRKIFRWEMVIIGSNEEATQITNYMIKNDAPFYVKGFVASGTDGVLGCTVSKTCLGNVSQLPEIATSTEINDIVVTDENIDKDLLLRILDYCIEQRLNVWFPPKLLPIIDIKIQPDYLCGLPMIRLGTQKSDWLFNPIKHGLDALMTLPLAIFLLPAFLLIALAVKLTSEGPVFYKPDAIGRHGNIFKMYKFRSMCVDSSCDIHKNYVTKLIKGEIGQKGTDGQTLKITDDPRITPVGKLLRRFSLDELPQLINVLKGEMSLVGPRPCLPYEYEQYEEWYKKRVSVRPGITGVWQVTGRSEVAFEDMILLDLYYIYNRSVLLDFQVLMETANAVLKQKGAF